MSERTASSAENSTSSVYSRASFTAFTAASTTWSGVMRSFFSMWMGEVAMKVWMRPRLAGLIASPAARMSRSLARASEQTVEFVMASAMALMASASPGLAAAKPASITSTPIFSSWRAMRSFSSLVIDAPGLCSPSRKVVSKMYKRSFMAGSMVGRRRARRDHADALYKSAASGLRRGGTAGGGGSVCAREAQQQAAEQNVRQAEDEGGLRPIRHSLNCMDFSPGCKRRVRQAAGLRRKRCISAST